MTYRLFRNSLRNGETRDQLGQRRWVTVSTLYLCCYGQNYLSIGHCMARQRSYGWAWYLAKEDSSRIIWFHFTSCKISQRKVSLHCARQESNFAVMRTISLRMIYALITRVASRREITSVRLATWADNSGGVGGRAKSRAYAVRPPWPRRMAMDVLHTRARER